MTINMSPTLPSATPHPEISFNETSSRVISVGGSPGGTRRRSDLSTPSSSMFLLRNGPGSFQLSDGIVATAHNFINNTLLQSKTRTWIKVFDPASQCFLSRVPESTFTEVQQAVTAAMAAQVTWALTTPHQRRAKMLDLVNVLQLNRHRIITCLVSEIGKTISDAETEFERGLDSVLATTARAGNDLTGSCWTGASSSTHTIHDPLGVCVSVTPFNFPFMIPFWTIPVALLTGNSVILKPSERAPSTSMMIAECFRDAGFPPGVFNIIHGGPNVVSGLLSQPAVMAIHYVGSDIGGERVYEHAKANRKRVQVECGGKNHAVVMPDASRTSTLYALAGSAFGAAGQRCMASSVAIFVGNAIDWLEELVTIANSLIVGCGTDPAVSIGPLISPAAKQRVVAMINEAEQDGAHVLLDGRNCYVEGYPDGNFVGPTILANVEPYMQCYQEEIFGPVLLCLQADTLRQAIDLINDSRYGNGCTLFSSNPGTATSFSREVNVGQIGINIPVIAPSGSVPRTTNKESFLGDMHGMGASQWQFYTMAKTVMTMWQEAPTEPPTSC